MFSDVSPVDKLHDFSFYKWWDFMFNVGEKVMYSVNGVCEITEITEKTFSETKMKYYVLKPLYNSNATLFVPTENESLTSKMKKLLTRNELDKVLDEISVKEINWNKNDIERRDSFRNIISYGNVTQIIEMLKAIWLQRRSLVSRGRKLHITDEIYLRDAEKMIKEEISTVIGVEQEEVLPYIKEKIL